MNLEEFGPDAKDEMSPSDYIQYCLERYREYRILAMDPTINMQAYKLYSDKAHDYYVRAQEAMDEIEPDNTDHLSDEDKALPNVSLADQEAEMNEINKNRWNKIAGLNEEVGNNNGNKQTAVDFLLEQLKFINKEAYNDLYVESFSRAKAMEKEQHELTWERGSYSLLDSGSGEDFDEYYSETYGG
jgi:hypothetical protein